MSIRRAFVSLPKTVKVGIIALGTLLLLASVFLLGACSGSTSASSPVVTPTPIRTPISTPTPLSTYTSNTEPSGLIAQKWIDPQVGGDTVSIPVSELESNWNTRFRVQTASGEITAMAYMLDGKIYARANVCPPCRSVGFSLSGDILVCNSCGTKFKATTGEGVSGACVKYPKAAVNYEITGGKVVMTKADLLTAYQNTLNPGWP